MYRKAAIAGIGQTEFSKGSPHTPWELALEAVLKALDDAGLDASAVDGIARFSGPFEPVSQAMLVRGLGIPELRWFSEAPHGGEALGAVVGHSAAAIAAGLASVVVVYRALKQSGGGRFGRADQPRSPGGVADPGPPGRRPRGGAPPSEKTQASSEADEVMVVPEQDNRSFAWPYGLMSPGQFFALWATRYQYQYGLSDEDLTLALGTVAITQRRYANNNPAALMRERTLDWDGYRSARMISRPLRLFDLCLENDGAVALVLTAAETARGLRDDPVFVLSAGQSLSPYREPMGTYPDDLLQLFPPTAAGRLFQAARLRPEDVSVAELYDATSFMTMRSLESYGFVPEGQGWRYLVEQGIGPHSPLPVNTHGGHLSEGYLHGMNGVLEAVRQLRGTACNQVPGAEVALVGAPAGSAVILGR
ncbi:MAG: lipid-transfer protein [Candidatus Dormibacteraeota bacterium]|nr:lipid-transfer protein [Candidatus Dormibacteraeota bacterium]